MRLSRFLTAVLVLTVISLGYAHQKTQIIKLNLAINNSHSSLNLTVDRNLYLLYNNLVLESPDTIDTRLAAQRIALVRPESWQRVSIKKKPQMRPSEIATLDIFTFRSIAEAGSDKE